MQPEDPRNTAFYHSWWSPASDFSEIPDPLPIYIPVMCGRRSLQHAPLCYGSLQNHEKHLPALPWKIRKKSLPEPRSVCAHFLQTPPSDPPDFFSEPQDHRYRGYILRSSDFPRVTWHGNPVQNLPPGQHPPRWWSPASYPGRIHPIGMVQSHR